MQQTAEKPFPQSLVAAFRSEPGKPAFEYRSRSVSRAEVLDLIARCVGGLRRSGLEPGAAVALGTDVTPEGFAVQIAAHLLGLQVVGLRPGLTSGQLADVLSRGIHAVITDTPTADTPTADTPGGDTPAGAALRTAAGPVPVLPLAALLDAPATPDALQPHGRPDDTAVVYLTSGSTGRPKGCALSYRALTAHWSWQPARWSEETTRLAAQYHRFLLFGTLTSAVMFEWLGLCLLGGGTAVIPDPPVDIPADFARHRITACLMTVPRLHRLLDTLRSTPVDLSSLRALLVAGSPLEPHRLTEAVDRLGPVVLQGYGQTETGLLTLLTPDDLARRHPRVAGSVGRAHPGVRLQIRDSAGRPVPAGERGEVWARTSGAMAGYWHDPDETAEVLRDGWIRTRDLGRFDEEGFLHLEGRTRDIIIVNAVVHYATAIERSLTDHPDIDQAYVVGLPDEQTGEAAHAFVVPTAGRTPDPAALRRHIGGQLGQAGVPATITVLDQVPTTPGGKPDKRALAALRRPPGPHPGHLPDPPTVRRGSPAP
ncbi:class I adenylate-forming enzyme family protein [Streptomyces sp. NPDC092296]|uniref:class I adenylate-forming enzyme family protein n=1 Tax=Streptomyces sp. NPDC092296 TaxID=3366012 RepID=UPI0037FB8208